MRSSARSTKRPRQQDTVHIRDEESLEEKYDDVKSDGNDDHDKENEKINGNESKSSTPGRATQSKLTIHKPILSPSSQRHNNNGYATTIDPTNKTISGGQGIRKFTIEQENQVVSDIIKNIKQYKTEYSQKQFIIHEVKRYNPEVKFAGRSAEMNWATQVLSRHKHEILELTQPIIHIKSLSTYTQIIKPQCSLNSIPKLNDQEWGMLFPMFKDLFSDKRLFNLDDIKEFFNEEHYIYPKPQSPTSPMEFLDCLFETVVAPTHPSETTYYENCSIIKKRTGFDEAILHHLGSGDRQASFNDQEFNETYLEFSQIYADLPSLNIRDSTPDGKYPCDNDLCMEAYRLYFVRKLSTEVTERHIDWAAGLSMISGGKKFWLTFKTEYVNGDKFSLDDLKGLDYGWFIANNNSLVLTGPRTVHAVTTFQDSDSLNFYGGDLLSIFMDIVAWLEILSPVQTVHHTYSEKLSRKAQASRINETNIIRAIHHLMCMIEELLILEDDTLSIYQLRLLVKAIHHYEKHFQDLIAEWNKLSPNPVVPKLYEFRGLSARVEFYLKNLPRRLNS